MMKDLKYTISILLSKYIKNVKLQSIILNTTSEFMQHNIWLFQHKHKNAF